MKIEKVKWVRLTVPLLPRDHALYRWTANHIAELLTSVSASID